RHVFRGLCGSHAAHPVDGLGLLSASGDLEHARRARHRRHEGDARPALLHAPAVFAEALWDRDGRERVLASDPVRDHAVGLRLAFLAADLLALSVGARQKNRGKEPRRCAWAGSDPRMIAYHDREWGVPVRNDQRLFEFLVLEGAQAGLSWSTILNKRQNYRKAFLRFDPKKVARFDGRREARLLRDPGIVRHRMKVAAAVENARRMLEVRAERGSFSRYVWSFVGGAPIQNRRSGRTVPAQTKESEALSKDLSGRGFRFVGPTIMYAFMQAVGMVNDHATTCFRYKELARAGTSTRTDSRRRPA